MKSIRKETGTFSSFDGADIYYESRGEGEPIIFCYGIGCLFNHWIHQVTFFSQTHNVIMFDYRGHHQSKVPENKSSLTIESLAKDLIALCEHLKIKKAKLVGHSFGVPVLLTAYEMKPKLFDSMVFINGLYQNPFDTIAESKELLEGIEYAKKLYNQAPGMISFLWEKGVTNPLLVPISSILGGFNISKTAMKDIEIYAKGVANIDIRVFITFFEEMVAFNRKDILSKIRIPVLIVCGSKDALTPLDEQKIMEELIPNSELYVVPYGSHCTQLDFPEMVNLKIQQFYE